MDDYHTDIREMVRSVLDHCTQCREPFGHDDLRVVGRTGNLWVLTIRCGRCDAQSYVAAVVGEYGMDIAEAEAGNWEGSERQATDTPISAADVLDVREFLDSFDGDFQQLFARRG